MFAGPGRGASATRYTSQGFGLRLRFRALSLSRNGPVNRRGEGCAPAPTRGDRLESETGFDSVKTAETMPGIGHFGSRIPAYSDPAADTSPTRRKGFRQMMEKVRQGLVDMIFIEDSSRISRNPKDLTQTVQELTSYGVELHDTKRGRLSLVEVLLTADTYQSKRR